VNDPVPELLRLLGQPVVLIGWPKGSKGTKKPWKHLTPANMTPEYLAKLPDGNIGVALGEKSSGLCAIDLDDDSLVDPFLDLNPHLVATLQTHGARGRVFWLRFRGDYPTRSTKLKTQSGEALGEFRSNGNQSIIWGRHPSGIDYSFIVRQPVLEITFDSINWPKEIANPPKIDGDSDALNTACCVPASLHALRCCVSACSA
jgi:hypothetical protein